MVSRQAALEMRAIWRKSPKWGVKSALARQYGVSPTCVKNILSGLTHHSEKPRNILTEDDVRLIRIMAESGLCTYDEIAEQYRVSVWTIGQAVRRRTWTNVV